jgi:serine protease Do
MKPPIQLAHRLSSVLFVPTVMFILVGVLKCSQPANQAMRGPLAMAAQDTAPTPTAPMVSGQPFIAVAKHAKATVVNISSVKKQAQRAERFSTPFFDDPFFRRFFGEEFEERRPQPRHRQEQGLGSGVIVTPNGYIVTNNHVVEEADELTVSLPDKRTYKAKVIGTDPKTDVAVVKIEASNLPVLSWGDASQLQVGEMVLAVGNPFGLSQTVTMGIISAVGRANMGIVDYEDFIQTDAAINPGNSGGALVNLNGELIGINTAIFSRSGGYMGIGFAIPSNMAKNVMDSLIKHGKVVRGWLGVSIQEVTQDLAQEFGTADIKGALLADIIDDGPAAKAKLERGDIITAYQGKVINDPSHMRALVAETPPGTTVPLSVWRNKTVKEITVTIGEQPNELVSTKNQGSGKGDHALTGITVEDVKPGSSGRSKVRTGVMVTVVELDSPADRAGLRRGDIIQEINRKPVKHVRDFERLTKELTPMTPVLLLLVRDTSTIFLSINAEP